MILLFEFFDHLIVVPLTRSLFFSGMSIAERDRIKAMHEQAYRLLLTVFKGDHQRSPTEKENKQLEVVSNEWNLYAILNSYRNVPFF